MDPRLQPYTLKTETQFLFPQFRFRAPPGNDHEVRSDELRQRFTSIRIPYIHEAEPPPRFRSAVCAAYHDFMDGQAGWDADLSERSLVALIETCSREVLATLRCELEPAFVREKCFDAEASRGEAAKWILQGGEIGTTRIENCVPLLSISSKKAQWIGFKEVAKDAGRENVVCGDQTACYAELGDSIVRRRTVEAGIVKRGRLNDYVLRGGGPTASWKREHLELCTEILDENSGEVSFAFEDKFHEWKAEFCVEHGGKGDERAPSDGVCGEGVAELGRQIPGLTRVTPRNVGRQNTDQPSTAKFIINLENGKLDQSATLQEKEAPILCESLNTHGTALDVLLSAALQELESIFEGESFPEWPIQSDPKAAPFLQLFAADAVPDCEFRRLPVVVLMEEDPCEKLEAESKLETWREGVELCAVKPQSVCHLELYLDWGLSDPAASTTKKGIDDMLREWKPQRSPFCQPKRKDAIAMMIQQDCKADPFQEIACNKVQSTPPEANGVPRQITQRKSSKSTPLQGCFEQTRAATIQESDKAAGGLKINKKVDIQDDFDFFLELHSSKRAQEKDGNQSVMETEPKTIDQMLETAQEIETEPEVRVENVPLPPSMTSLLVQLAKEHDGVVLSCNGLPGGATKSGLMDVEAMTVTLKGLAEVKGSRESPPIEVFQTCSLLVVLRQTAVLLLHFGPRVGFLYMKQSMNDLVALRGRLCDISKLLAEAYFDVERGKTWDHPKLDALKNVLTLSTDGKAKRILVLCDPCAFFTLYPVISKCGLKPYQLDRDGSIHTLSQEGVRKLVSKALDDGKCILASHPHLALPGFPLESINCVVEYSQMLGTADTTRNAKTLVQKWITLQATNPISTVAAFREEAEWNDSRVSEQGVNTTRSQLDFPEESQKGSVVEATVVMNSREGSPVNIRRDLFEAIVHLETKGVAIVNRDLGYVDIAFPPSVAICIWAMDGQTCPEGSEDLAVEGILDRMSGVFHAYSSIIICIEGRGALVSALIVRLASLQAACSLKDIHMNIFSTTSPRQTQDFAINILSSLQRTTSTETFSKFALTDMQSPTECFLQRLPFLNPFSVHAVSRLRPTLREIIDVVAEDWEKVSKELPEVSPAALEVCSILFSEGKPIIGDAHAFENEQQIDGSDVAGPDECYEDLDMGGEREAMHDSGFQSNECMHIDPQTWMDMQNLAPLTTTPPEFALLHASNRSKDNGAPMVNGDENDVDGEGWASQMQPQMNDCYGAPPAWRENSSTNVQGGGVDDFDVLDAILETSFGGCDMEGGKSGSSPALEYHGRGLDRMNWEVDREFDGCPDNSFLQDHDPTKSGLEGGLATIIDEWEAERSRKLPCSSSREKDDVQDLDLNAMSPRFHPGHDVRHPQNQPGVDEFGVWAEAFVVQSQGAEFERSLRNGRTGPIESPHTREENFLRGVKGSIDLRTAQWNDFSNEETCMDFSQVDDFSVRSETMTGMDDLGHQDSNVTGMEKGNRQWGNGGHWVNSNFLKFKRR